MAVVTVGIQTLQTRITFIKPPDMVRQFTAIPRAILTFSANAAAVAAKPVNDQLELQVNMSLPTQFAYRLISLHANIIQTQAQDYTNPAYLVVQNGIRTLPAGQSIRHIVEVSVAIRIPTPLTTLIARMEATRPTYIIQSNLKSTGGPVQPIVGFHATNQVATASLAGTIDFLCQFYEYDIEQVQMYPPLVPALTYAVS